MKIPNDVDFDRYQWEEAIDRWIFNEEHRAMLKRNLLDGRTYEQERKIYFDMLEKLNKK